MGHRRKSHHQVNEYDDEKYPAVQTKATHRKLKRPICLPRDASSESYRDADCKRKKRHKRKNNKHNKHRQRHRAYDSQSPCKVKHAERSHARAQARKRSKHHFRHQSDSDSCSSESSSSYSYRSRTRREMTKRARLQQHDYTHDCHTTETNALKEIAGKVTAVSCGSRDVKEEDGCGTDQNNLKPKPGFQRYKCQDKRKDKSLEEAPKSKENLDGKLLLQSSVLARRELKPGSGNAEKTVGGEATGLGSEGSGLDFLERQLRKHALANYMRYLDSTDLQKGGLFCPKDHSNQDREPFELKHDVTDTHMGVVVEQVSDLDSRNIVALTNSEMDSYHVCPVADSHLQETKVEEGQRPLRDEFGLQNGCMETQAAATVDHIAERNEGAKFEDAERLHRQIKAKFHDDERCISFTTEGLNVEELKSVNMPQVTDLTSLNLISKSATHVSAEGNAKAEIRFNEMKKISVKDSNVIAESTHSPVERHSKGQQKDASMFQQKTMSVMQGGEMVQVNYKVYIPQRATERAKRRLQR